MDPSGRELSAYAVLRRNRSVVFEDAGGIGGHANRGSSEQPLDHRGASFVGAAELASQVVRCGTYLGIPLKIGAHVVGVLEIYLREARSIPTDELRQYAALCAQAAVALQNALLVEEAGRRKRDLDLLAGLAEIIAEGNREALGWDVLNLVVEAIGAEGALLSIRGGRGRSVREIGVGICESGAEREGLGLLARWVGENQETVWHSGSEQLDSVIGPVSDGGLDGGEPERPKDRVADVWPSIIGKWPEVSYCPLVVAPVQGGALCIARSASSAPFSGDDMKIIETVGRVLGSAAVKTIG
jgi:hypothetical protein